MRVLANNVLAYIGLYGFVLVTFSIFPMAPAFASDSGNTVNPALSPLRGTTVEDGRVVPAPRVVTRVFTERELDRLGDRDWDLSPSASLRILARINARDFDYIHEDIKSGRPLKVPTDFSAYKRWTPLSRWIPEVSAIPKFILVVKDIPFLGWYERGRLVGDSYTCVGRQDDWTRAGVYRVLEKDPDHVSSSYPNAFGEPAPMPFALRIHGAVWIHAGDIIGGHCSHGCINLPVGPAVSLFKWADKGTPVLVTGSLSSVETVLRKNNSNCSLFASRCTQAERRLY